MKNNLAILGMIFGAGIGIIFNSTGLGLPMGAGAGLVLWWRSWKILAGPLGPVRLYDSAG